ncbi:MAG: hypothetical protein GAK45_00986 [Pseudomonas citronellolis]|nr:MAG: hypothetical protein GAK45_00986 [Pseudomonas citronellolis]
MKKWLLGLAVLSMASGAFAAGKPCEELKSEIDAKIKAKGASGYTLEVVDKGSAGDKKVVGSCEAGTKEIVYSRH